MVAIGGPRLTPAQRSCILRALHKAHEALSDEKMRLQHLGAKLSRQEAARLTDVEGEMECLAASINWMWLHG